MAGCASAARPEASYLTGFTQAEREATTFQPASATLQGLDFAWAYRLQARIVRTRLAGGDRLAGFKGSLMSPKSLADKGVTGPLTGVLFASGDLANGTRVSLCGYRRAALEMKLGFVFDKAVRRPIANIEALKSYVREIQPVVELPDIAYLNGDNYSALDMVAANISSARFVRGAPHPIYSGDLDTLPVILSRDGVQLTRGLGRDSLDGQWSSLLTVVNLVVAHGGAIRSGQLVLTGKIGDKIAVTAGSYRADYGDLGTVNFQLASCARP